MHRNSYHFELISSHNVHDLKNVIIAWKKSCEIPSQKLMKISRTITSQKLNKKILFLTFFSLLGFSFSLFFHFNCTTAQPKLKLMSTDTLIFVQLEMHFVEHFSRETQLKLRSFDLLSSYLVSLSLCFVSR